MTHNERTEAILASISDGSIGVAHVATFIVGGKGGCAWKAQCFDTAGDEAAEWIAAAKEALRRSIGMDPISPDHFGGIYPPEAELMAPFWAAAISAARLGPDDGWPVQFAYGPLVGSTGGFSAEHLEMRRKASLLYAKCWEV